MQAEGQPASPSCRGQLALFVISEGSPAVAVLGCSDGEAGKEEGSPPCSDWHCLPSSRVYAPERPSVEFLFLLAPQVPLLSPSEFSVEMGQAYLQAQRYGLGVQGVMRGLKSYLSCP